MKIQKQILIVFSIVCAASCTTEAQTGTQKPGSDPFAGVRPRPAPRVYDCNKNLRDYQNTPMDKIFKGICEFYFYIGTKPLDFGIDFSNVYIPGFAKFHTPNYRDYIPTTPIAQDKATWKKALKDLKGNFKKIPTHFPSNQEEALEDLFAGVSDFDPNAINRDFWQKAVAETVFTHVPDAKSIQIERQAHHRFENGEWLFLISAHIEGNYALNTRGPAHTLFKNISQPGPVHWYEIHAFLMRWNLEPPFLPSIAWHKGIVTDAKPGHWGDPNVPMWNF